MNNISSNDLTLNAYALGINEYIVGSPSETNGIVQEWIDNFLKLLPTNANIVEIGSAHGRDAQYIESCGFSVERTDATLEFVTYLKNKGHAACSFNILTDDFKSSYDLIFANAVFLHFTPDELGKVLTKVHASLVDKGILAFSVKLGGGEEWTSVKLGNPRYFCYWTSEGIQSLLESSGFDVIFTSTDEKFVQITARRK
ncbi:MAG: class I SAM-dependent methyltransferase [Parachlamydiaceae bacterium]|nr:class I SAM-dependent methyltransferase [Parachlamydiaceae bacterium]